MTSERRTGFLAALSVAAVILALSALRTDGATRIAFIVVAMVAVGTVVVLLSQKQPSGDAPSDT